MGATTCATVARALMARTSARRRPTCRRSRCSACAPKPAVWGTPLILPSTPYDAGSSAGLEPFNHYCSDLVSLFDAEIYAHWIVDAAVEPGDSGLIGRLTE